MALNWGDVALNFTAGAIEKSEAKRKEDLEQRFQELQDNKELYRALATTRYSKDLEKYYKETEKYENLQDVYKQIQSANGGQGMGKREAAMMIIGATPQLAFSYKNAADEDAQNAIINSVMSGFKDTYRTVDTGGGAGSPETTKEVVDGFTFSHAGLNLQAPNPEDYFQDPNYWGKLAKEIKSGTTGPLQKQILKLLGKEPAEVDLNQLDQKAGTTIKQDIDSLTYSSKNTSEGMISGDGFNWSDFQDNNTSWITQFNNLVKDVTWNNINKNDHFLSWMTTNNLLGANTEANFKLDNNDTEITGLNPAATAMLETYKNVYNEVVKSFDAKTLASMGIDITELSDNISVAEVNKVVQRMFEQRAIKDTLGTGSIETNTDFISFLPLNIADAHGTYTTAEGDSYNIFTDESNIPQIYHNWLKGEAEKIKEKYEVSGKNPEAKMAMAMMEIQRSVSIDGPYAKAFKEFLDGEIKKAINTPENEKDDTQIDGNLNVDKIVSGKQDGKDGFTDGTKFQTWEAVEEKGIVEQILNKYPHLREAYEKWKSSQSNMSNTSNKNTISVKGKEIETSGSTDNKKENVNVETDNNKESTSSGVGDKPWLFSDGTFNPNFDTSSIDMDKKYTVGTEANEYLKAKNLYEREERKNNSILNKFFN